MPLMDTALGDRLRAEWRSDFGGGDADDADVDAAFDELVACYGEPHRRYHTIEHVASVLRFADSLAGQATEPAAVRMAAWYHDAVYDPDSADNEARSAVLAAANLAGMAVPPELVREAARLIELTAGHRTAATDPNGAVLLDSDLAILAAAPDRYDRYVAGIRHEYSHLDDASFRTGRARLLEGLLGRAYVFNTPVFRTEREARARANLQRELAELTA
jgi:predicted metal-dependent HD superfamily phosphohydrolase